MYTIVHLKGLHYKRTLNCLYDGQKGDRGITGQI